MNIRSATATSLAPALALVTLLTAPLASHADSDAAMDACIKAFVATSLPKENPISVNKGGTQDSVELPGRTYRITLTAKGKTSGKQFATATCIADRAGSVVALNGRRIERLADVKVAEKTAAR